MLGRRLLILEKLDADLFLWSNWDTLPSERSCRLRFGVGGTDVWDVGHEVVLEVSARPAVRHVS